MATGSEPVLWIFAGLPGVGKTTLARALAGRLGAVYLRIDTIERALAETQTDLVGPEGYVVGCALAEENLRLGHHVVGDAVNPLTMLRDAWAGAAKRAGARMRLIEIRCSDALEQRCRLAARGTPLWAPVEDRAFAPVADPDILHDTAGEDVATSIARLFARLGV